MVFAGARTFISASQAERRDTYTLAKMMLDISG